MLRVAIHRTSSDANAPLRPGETATAIIRREIDDAGGAGGSSGAEGPVSVSLVLADGRIGFSQELRLRPGATVGVEFAVPAADPSGPIRFLAVKPASPTRAPSAGTVVAAARVEFEGTVPAQPIWRYRQRFSVGDTDGLRYLDLSALVPRAIPLKLAIFPPEPPASSTDDVFGNRWARARFFPTDLAAAGVPDAPRTRSGGRRAVPILIREFDLVSYTMTGHLPALIADPALSGPGIIELPAHWQPFLQPEPHIESDAPEVRELAQRVPFVSEAGVVAVARHAFSVTRGHLRYVLQRHEHGARYAAQTGEGDCTEYAALFCALCRARGLPARVAAGVFGDDPKVAHAIAEVYVNGLWFPLDPTMRADFHLGQPAAFVPMMRANWMDAARAYQPYHLTYVTAADTPRIVFSESYSRQPTLSSQAAPKPPAFRIRPSPDMPAVGAASPPAGVSAAPVVPTVGGEWARAMPDRPTFGVTVGALPFDTAVAAAREIEIVAENPGRSAWRVVLVAAVEPTAPLIFAVREIRLPAGQSLRVRLLHPHAIPSLAGTTGLLVTALSGDKLIFAQTFPLT